MKKDRLGTLKTIEAGGHTAEFYSLPQLEAQGIGAVSRLPVSVRILLESVLRNCDGRTCSVSRAGSLMRNERKKYPLRIETPVEVESYLHGGILPYVLKKGSSPNARRKAHSAQGSLKRHFCSCAFCRA